MMFRIIRTIDLSHNAQMISKQLEYYKIVFKADLVKKLDAIQANINYLYETNFIESEEVEILNRRLKEMLLSEALKKEPLAKWIQPDITQNTFLKNHFLQQ